MVAQHERPFSSRVFIGTDLPGERAGTRTQDPRIKSAMLYHLSYALSPFINLLQYGSISRARTRPLPILSRCPPCQSPRRIKTKEQAAQSAHPRAANKIGVEFHSAVASPSPYITIHMGSAFQCHAGMLCGRGCNLGLL